MSERSGVLAGRSLSHYQIERLLGEGGMGEVFLARDTVLNRRVALKILPESFSSDADRLRRFLREARTASAVSHANVAHIYEVAEADGVHFIAMEYVEGRSLAQVLAEGPLAPARAVEVAREIADALAEAHAHGIVHRDIKPGNVMLTDRGQVKVLDFGLAKTLFDATDDEASDKLPTLTKTAAGIVLGTLPYMSPEQALGQPVDARSDLFSLGILLYEATTGRRPFNAGTAAASARSDRAPRRSAASSVQTVIPAWLNRIVARCLQKLPEDRYQTARDLLVDLRREGTSLRRRPARRLIAVTLTALLVVAGLVALLLRAWGDRLDERAPGTERCDPTRPYPLAFWRSCRSARSGARSDRASLPPVSWRLSRRDCSSSTRCTSSPPGTWSRLCP